MPASGSTNRVSGSIPTVSSAGRVRADQEERPLTERDLPGEAREDGQPDRG